MKRYVLACLLLILMLNDLFAEIKNGYEQELLTMQVSFHNLKNLLQNNPHLTAAEKRRINNRIQSVVKHLAYYKLTDTLLNQFSKISPELYTEIDNLKDSEGRTIDVYVKFVPKEKAQILSQGMASFHQAPDDPNSCNSEYGEGSVSVQVWILSKALWVLSHEFGHVKYVVPNLKSYVEFYKSQYKTGLEDPLLGHRPGDPSGKFALLFEQRFRKHFSQYSRENSNHYTSPMALINPIRRNIVQTLDRQTDDPKTESFSYSFPVHAVW